VRLTGNGKMTDIIKLDPKEFGLEESKAADIAAQFKPMLDKMVELEQEYNEVIALPIEEAAPKAKALRLKYVKVRTGTEKIHKEQKAFYLSAGRFVDGWKNTQLFASDGIEKKLQDIEDHAANKEKERIAALQSEREALLVPYGVENANLLQLGQMTQDVFNNFLLGTKTAHDQRIEAERLAEEQRLAAIEAERIRLEEQAKENERLKLEAEAKEKELAVEREAARLAQEAAEIERKRIQDEADAKLAEQAKEAARLAKIEADKLAAIKESNRIVREKSAAALAAEQAAAKKLADELQARKDAEAKAEAERITAEKKAAKAPDNDKLKAFVVAIQLPAIPELSTAEANTVLAELRSKFTAYINWANKQVEAL
jgi:colicin import membrane protein